MQMQTMGREGSGSGRGKDSGKGRTSEHQVRRLAALHDLVEDGGARDVVLVVRVLRELDGRRRAAEEVRP